MQNSAPAKNIRGAGRKPRPEHLVRTQVQRVRLTPEEMRAVQRLATERGLNPPNLLRSLLVAAAPDFPRPLDALLGASPTACEQASEPETKDGPALPKSLPPSP